MDTYYYKLLHEVQENGFALVDLQLYLDTHSDDPVALQHYEAYSKRQRLLKRAFEDRYGPLNHYGESSVAQGVDQWIFSPWPWEV